MKDDNKMVIAMAISGAVAGGILDYQNQTKAPPEPVPVVQTVEQPPEPIPPKPCTKEQPDSEKPCK